MYENFTGISCHELFHAWNVLKIRPEELMPYDFSKENYFRTGYVMEGVTTYYGDLLLARAGVYTIDQYFKELSALFQKHFESFGNYTFSLADSSFDLWVDGYVPGIPNRKVSIYVKGAVVALILDLEIRRLTKNKNSMDDLMRLLWEDFGKKGTGYSENEYREAAEKIAGQSLEDYFSECIYGTTSLEETLNNALQFIGCELEASPSSSVTENYFGFRFCVKDERSIVEMIEPNSPADKVLSKDDEIISVNGINISNNLEHFLKEKHTATLTIRRWGKVVERVIARDGRSYMKKYKIRKRGDVTEGEKINFKSWIGKDF
jgi:predicted metalloprotease with PDZ domain